MVGVRDTGKNTADAGRVAAGESSPGPAGPGGEAGMPIRVRLFAVLAERWGGRELALTLPAGATTAAVIEGLRAARPDLEPLLNACRVAVNGRYAGPDQPLAAGDEVALIPPVSGGAGDLRGETPSSGDVAPGSTSAAPAGRAHAASAVSPGGTASGSRSPGEPDDSGARVPAPAAERFFITSRPLSLDELFRHVAGPEHGAVVLFVGITRRFTGGRETRHLEYEAYARMAAEELARIGAEAEERWPGARLAIGHRTGRVDIGEASVVIAAAAPHRPDAFAAARYAIEELKRRAPIWKKEHYADGTVEWVGIGPEPGAGSGPQPDAGLGHVAGAGSAPGDEPGAGSRSGAGDGPAPGDGSGAGSGGGAHQS